MRRFVVSDYTECPQCAVENAVVGGVGTTPIFAFNYRGQAWNACLVHGVRWYVTREIGFLDEDDGALMVRLTEVVAIDHRGPV